MHTALHSVHPHTSGLKQLRVQYSLSVRGLLPHGGYGCQIGRLFVQHTWQNLRELFGSPVSTDLNGVLTLHGVSGLSYRHANHLHPTPDKSNIIRRRYIHAPSEAQRNLAPLGTYFVRVPEGHNLIK